jgi:hypothetical protein
MSDYVFPSVTLCDPMGTKIVMTEDSRQLACLNIRLQPRAGGDPEVVLNRTTAILLQKALGLWLEHLEGEVSLALDEEDDPDE